MYRALMAPSLYTNKERPGCQPKELRPLSIVPSIPDSAIRLYIQGCNHSIPMRSLSIGSVLIRYPGGGNAQHEIRA